MSELDTIISDIEIFAKQRMVKDILHGWPHIQRVLKYAQLVSKELGGHWPVVHAAVLMHDLGHAEDSSRHHEIGADIAGDFLKKKGISEKIVFHVKECILTHSRQLSLNQPSSIEAKILFDADGMDLFGACGVIRALLSCGLKHKGFDCMIKKLKWRLTERDNFNSKTALNFAHKNSGIIQTFLEQLKAQLEIFSE
jgi:HD superfamily phosphodiesterase